MPEKCNVPAEELPGLLAKFPGDLLPDEEQFAIQMFGQYLFYHRTGRRRRLYLCTSCGDCWTDDAGAAHPGHNALWHCPRCGARVTMKAAGKLTGGWGYPSLFEQHNLVVLRASDDGGLLVSGGRVTVSYAPGELHGWPYADSDYIFPVPTMHYSERRRYYMSKGRLASWKWDMEYDGCQAVGGHWLPAVSAGEPIPFGSFCSPQPDDGYYFVLGWDAMGCTELRYSAVTEYFDTERTLHHGVVSYLARYTRRPQIEMLV